ncbi:hypothetical protein OAT96_02710 [Chitinophagales bacterium]|nr:hypothetical protein [Chitinophagales bacterium]
MAIGLPAFHEVRKKHGMLKTDCEAIVKDALASLPWIEIGYMKDAFDYRTQGTMLTFAERILIYVGETEILVKSTCLFPAQFLDFGKNKRNIDTFFTQFNDLNK